MKLNEELAQEAAGVYARTDGFQAGINAAILHYLTNRSLPDRMREAAETLREANGRAGNGFQFPWMPGQLNRHADHWEAEDHEKDERDDLVEDIAQTWWSERHGEPSDWWEHMGDGARETFRQRARVLIAKFDITRREQS
ncbi:hypothetical protein PP713_13920 [Mycobacterium sp. CSUR Q5927]|nr:hypothetical protein [Mycobacterium sp. CSUR Q5927]